MKRSFLAVSAALAVAAALLTACGGGGGSNKPATTGPLPQPDAVLSKAVDAFQGMKTFHFRLEHDNGGTQIPPGLTLITADGDVIVPDRMSAKLDAKAGQQSVNVQVIGVGDQGWITNPFSRQWQPLPSGTSIKDIFDPAQGVKAVIGSLQNAQVTGEETVDGTLCYRIEGSVASEVLQAAAPIAKPGLTVGIKVWIGEDDSLIRQVYLIGPLAPDEPSNIVRRLMLSKFGEDISIDAPQ
ncbi:MAG: LppX_LprAFG lipoprotein [Dehalococcoidia bacterium]|jgi:hypothetical protein